MCCYLKVVLLLCCRASHNANSPLCWSLCIFSPEQLGGSVISRDGKLLFSCFFFSVFVCSLQWSFKFKLSLQQRVKWHVMQQVKSPEHQFVKAVRQDCCQWHRQAACGNARCRTLAELVNLVCIQYAGCIKKVSGNYFLYKSLPTFVQEKHLLCF